MARRAAQASVGRFARGVLGTRFWGAGRRPSGVVYARASVRCFVAAWPPPDVLAGLARLRRPDVAGVRWSTREQWHATLRFFGELSEEDVERASRALAQVAAAQTGPVEVTAGPTTRFLGPGLVVWPVNGLSALAGDVESATRMIGQAPPARRFSGHLTLARARGGADLRREGALVQPLEMSWRVSNISLVRSQLAPRGAHYSEVATFRLGEP